MKLEGSNAAFTDTCSANCGEALAHGRIKIPSGVTHAA